MRDEVQTGEQPKRLRWAEAVGQPAGSVEAYRTSPTRRAPASTKGNCPDLEVRDQRRNPRRDWTTATRLMIDAGRRSAGQSKSAAANDSFLSMRCLVVETLPAWTTNRLKRLVLSPKRHVVGAALAASTVRLAVNAVLRSGDLLGRLLDTFVARSCGPRSWSASHGRVSITCARSRAGFEVDVLGELNGGHVVGIEVKASARRPAAMRDIWWTPKPPRRCILGRDPLPHRSSGISPWPTE
jgi:hypothetical protein